MIKLSSSMAFVFVVSSVFGLAGCALQSETNVAEERSQLSDDPDEGGQVRGKANAVAPALADDPDEGGQARGKGKAIAPALADDPDEGGQLDGRQCTYRFGWDVYGSCSSGWQKHHRVDVYRCDGADERRFTTLPLVPCSNNPPQQP